jgi:O-antigen ligase
VIEQMPALSPSVRLDHAFLLRLADWLVVLVAISLPWSTTATGICIAAWLVVVLPGLDLESVRREVASARGGLPVALWCLGLIGMIWAGVDWTQRFEGLAGFHRLLVIPLLLAQFRRSDHGDRVICGFLISSAIVLVVSYILIIVPGLSPRDKVVGIPVHDDIFQGSIFIICGFGALGYAATEGIKRQLLVAFAFVVIAALFLANFLFVPIFSRIVLAVAPVLAGLLGWRLSRWRGLLGTFVLAVALSVAFWFASPNLRAHMYNSLDEFREYNARNTANSIGRHVAFLNESLEIISSAPLIGHGTGSIAEEFRQVTSAKNGAAGVATVNPHNQTFAVAIQIGLIGAIVLWSMWIAHIRLFHSEGIVAWLGTVVVVENIVSSTVHSHLFDFTNGWLYVFGVGVLGGMVLRQQSKSWVATPQVSETPHDIRCAK